MFIPERHHFFLIWRNILEKIHKTTNFQLRNLGCNVLPLSFYKNKLTWESKSLAETEIKLDNTGCVSLITALYTSLSHDGEKKLRIIVTVSMATAVLGGEPLSDAFILTYDEKTQRINFYKP